MGGTQLQCHRTHSGQRRKNKQSLPAHGRPQTKTKTPGRFRFVFRPIWKLSPKPTHRTHRRPHSRGWYSSVSVAPRWPGLLQLRLSR